MLYVTVICVTGFHTLSEQCFSVEC